MEVGDLVRFTVRHVEDRSAPMTGMVVIGQIMQIDGEDEPDAAFIKEIYATSIWGTSDFGAGTMHSVRLEDCQPWEPT